MTTCMQEVPNKKNNALQQPCIQASLLVKRLAAVNLLSLNTGKTSNRHGEATMLYRTVTSTVFT
jgi:hypothetical protein